MRMMIFGAGYSGQCIAAEALKAGAAVAGTTRSAEKMPLLRAAGMQPFLFDGSSLSEDLRAHLAQVTHLVQSIAPGAEGDRLVNLLSGDLRPLFPRLEWIGYLSTVGVYGDHAGAWVDEETPCRPVSTRSLERMDAELTWQALAESAGIPLSILRLSGIYGPGRNGFIALSKGSARRLVKPGQVFNRIRVEDIGRACLFLMERSLGGIFNVTDSEPAPPQDVVSLAAQLMGIDPPPEQAFETAELTPMARSFYGENKRVSNAKICNLGFKFLYPDYGMSLRQLWQDGRWEASETVHEASVEGAKTTLSSG
ncbi:SDR family oxidoreductase [Rhizobium sp. SSA_523]|uniref:SDR family oxidoreductase n=1 Tax=Rhizobium sp. SSA_523 TaxID=2952477 RepID=UPI0020901EFC|nr:SDR family oxidoreductase [Rhizobium sp. SSA_523]MCO5732711.1 SDR family oxidoreductase [Rhizobium sp. SSA_523]WKC25795.1 SDR family oxidoreductase [Rhizobium sp. SSA_523]